MTTLHSFNGTDGANPGGQLVQAFNGSFYGTTAFGGACSAWYLGCGTIFRVTSSGTLTTLHRFDGIEGSNPYGGLLQARSLTA
jgi:uncharacterized repeat protein (TIGR03803 family)